MNLRAPATTGLDDQDQSLASGPFNTSRRIGAFRLPALYQDRPELPGQQRTRAHSGDVRILDL